MSWQYDPLGGLWKMGVAYGRANIKTDTMSFIFDGESFEFPTLKVWPYVEWNGHFYEARVNDLRKLEAEQHANG